MLSKTPSNCAHCPLPSDKRICRNPEGKGPVGCPTLEKGELIEEALDEYAKKDIGEFSRQASIQEGQCYANRDRKPYMPHPTKPRIEEICEFADKMRYTRLGLVFCVGLRREGELVAQILEAKGFEVVSVVCKVGSVPKEKIGVKDDEKVRVGEYESMCNPILQAKIINDEKTHFNVVMGLCVGHDSLFFKYAEAPTTVLVAKDRVTGHNPMGAIYTSGSYYSRLGKRRS